MTRIPKAALGLAGALALAGPQLAQAASAVDLFYERALMSAADARCGLFTPQLGSTLIAAKAQARGAAVRSGVEAATLTQVEAAAQRKARAADCRSRDITLAASRVRTAFDGLQRLGGMDFPGDTAGWKAERTASRLGPTWGLSQTSTAAWGAATVGLVAGETGVTAVGVFADNARPYAARLVIRDTSRTSGPYLDRRQASAGRLPLSARIPPQSAVRAFNAERKTAAAEGLLPLSRAKGLKSGWAFRFSPEATDALARLDAREAVAVEFLITGRTGDIVRRAYVEVGDFAAGRAFVQLAQR